MGTADAAAGPGERGSRPGMWWARRAVALHTTLVVVVPTFVALFWWQVQRVREGNALSWAYVFEWPFFTGYAVYLWWKLVHDQPALAGEISAGETPRLEGEISAGETSSGETPSVQAPPPGIGDGESPEKSQADEELAAYNRYLAELNASGRRKVW